MNLGFVMRDLVRRRVAVDVHLSQWRMLAGTIDRAGADHLDIALHEPGTPRRAGEVTGHRIVPFAAVAWIRLDPARDDRAEPGRMRTCVSPRCGRRRCPTARGSWPRSTASTARSAGPPRPARRGIPRRSPRRRASAPATRRACPRIPVYFVVNSYCKIILT